MTSLARRWLRRASVLSALGFAVTAQAESNIVTIPGQGWHLVIDVPSLKTSRAQVKDGHFSYEASDPGSGFTFRVGTRLLAGGDVSRCQAAYWAEVSTSAELVQESVKPFKNAMLSGVTYHTRSKQDGRPYTTSNAHGYFMVKDSCVEVAVAQPGNAPSITSEVEKMIRTARVMNQK